MVNNREEAEQAVMACRYPPLETVPLDRFVEHCTAGAATHWANDQIACRYDRDF